MIEAIENSTAIKRIVLLDQHVHFRLRHKMRKSQIARFPAILLGRVKITQVDRRTALIKKLPSDFV